ncbi:hypothetical protein Tco_0594123 [Tanacetum coccineum]
MEISIADQIALDDALVAPADRLKIGKCNLRLSSNVTSKEATLQVFYDVLKLTPFYQAFQVTADAPEIYMQEFWATAYVHNRSVIFKMNNKKHILGLDQFRDILQICPKIGNKKFEEPPLEKEILAFLASLGHSGDIRKITDVNVNKLHQPWRSFAAVINKCLSGKPSYDSLRISQSQSVRGVNKRGHPHPEMIQIISAIASNCFLRKIPPPNTKGNKKKADTDTTIKMKPPIVPKEKQEKKSGKGKQKTTELETISEADLTEAEQLKIITKRSRQDSTLSQWFSGADEELMTKISDNEVKGTNVEGAKSDEDATYEEDQGKRAVERYTNTNLEWKDRRNSSSVSSGFVSNMLNPNQDTGVDDIFGQHTEATSLIDTPVTAIMEPSFTAQTIRPPTPNPLVIQTQQPPILTTRLKALEDNFSELRQTNQYAKALSSIPGIVDQYLANKMQEAVDVAVQLKYDRIREESNNANQQFLDSIDEGMKKIIKEQVKKEVSKITPKIEKLVIDQLESEVLVRSSKEANTSHAVAANLSELELKKILIDKMEAKQKHLSIGQNIQKAALQGISLMHDDQEPSAGTDRGSKRRRSGKEPASTSAPSETTTKTAGKTTTTGSKTHKQSASQSAPVEETMQTTSCSLKHLHTREFENRSYCYDGMIRSLSSQRRRLFTDYRIQDIEGSLTSSRARKTTNLNVKELIAFNVSLNECSHIFVIQKGVGNLQLGFKAIQKKTQPHKAYHYRSNL